MTSCLRTPESYDRLFQNSYKIPTPLWALEGRKTTKYRLEKKQKIRTAFSSRGAQSVCSPTSQWETTHEWLSSLKKPAWMMGVALETRCQLGSNALSEAWAQKCSQCLEVFVSLSAFRSSSHANGGREEHEASNTKGSERLKDGNCLSFSDPKTFS